MAEREGMGAAAIRAVLTGNEEAMPTAKVSDDQEVYT
jgi:hypothetical protein